MCFSTSFFFFNDTTTTEIYTLSLHDALPIFTIEGKKTTEGQQIVSDSTAFVEGVNYYATEAALPDRKSTRLNSSHSQISYAVFCLKKKTAAAAEQVEGSFWVVVLHLMAATT